MKRQRDTTPAHHSAASTPSSSSSMSSSCSSSCSPFSGSGGPAKRRRTQLTPKQQGGWLRLQEELAAEREKKVRLDWYLKELLVEMENLIAQEREARTDMGQGTGAGEWAEGASYTVKLRTYKQYCGFDSNPSGTTTLDHGADVALVRIKPEPTYEHYGDDAAGAYEDFLALSVEDLTSTVAMGSGRAPHMASTHFMAAQHSSVKSEPSPAESTCPPTTTANPEGEGTALEALFESSEGLDVSHFLNFEDDCHDYSMHSGDDSQSQQECTSSDDEAAGYTSSPSIDFGVAAGGAGMGFESWDEIELPKFGSAKAQEERTKAMGAAETKNKNESERRGEEKWQTMTAKTEEVTTEGDDGSSDWAFWSVDVLPALGF